MPPRTSAAPQIPGEFASNPTSEAVDSEPGETVTVDKAQLDAIMAQLADLKAKVAAGPVRVQASQTENLPDAAGIDAAQITAPVLTKSGWVVPAKFGANPAEKSP